MICIIPRFVTQHRRILSPVPATMPSVASSMPSVKAPAVGAAAMKEGMGSRNSSVARPSMAGPAGGAGMPSRRRMQVAGRVGRPMSGGTPVFAGTPAVKMVAMVHLSRMKIVAGRGAIYDASTMRDEALVVEDRPATMPITSPMVPTPAVAGE